MHTRPNVTFAAIRSGIVYPFLFVVVIAYILVFFRPLSVNSAKAFLIISTINEVTVLAFLVLGKRKFKSQFRETFIEEKPSTYSGYKTAFSCITSGAVAFETFGGIAGLMKAREFFWLLLFINKILQISVIITQSEFILHTMNTSFQTRVIQEKHFKVNRIFQCIFVLNISKWIVNTIIMGQKPDSSFSQRQFYGKKYWDIIKYSDISRQRILQISNIIRNVRALPKYTHSRLIVFNWLNCLFPVQFSFLSYLCICYESLGVILIWLLEK